MERTWCKYY